MIVNFFFNIIYGPGSLVQYQVNHHEPINLRQLPEPTYCRSSNVDRINH